MQTATSRHTSGLQICERFACQIRKQRRGEQQRALTVASPLEKGCGGRRTLTQKFCCGGPGVGTQVGAGGPPHQLMEGPSHQPARASCKPQTESHERCEDTERVASALPTSVRRSRRRECPRHSPQGAQTRPVTLYLKLLPNGSTTPTQHPVLGCSLFVFFFCCPCLSLFVFFFFLVFFLGKEGGGGREGSLSVFWSLLFLGKNK